ncbi:resistin-like [Rana temporaria]|uniref:resistin-like n=1 Tax=Rana temporaria TaxID=8407 RepID=UPI001AADE7BC|nr:resistin-like [Rana temporaria]
MKLCALALLLLLGLVNAHDVPCTLDKAIKNTVTQYCPCPTLECTSVSSPGSEVACPSGYAVSGCSCGMGCGSWDIREKSRCHCQCDKMDWTTAVCCRNKCQ